jgi:hypothetical protein
MEGRLLLGALCVFRLSHLLVAEDGPWDLVVRIRRAAGSGVLGKLLDCFYCTSLWVAVPFAWLLGQGLPERLLFIPALSGAAILLERITAARATPPPQVFYEEDQRHEELLREPENGGGGGPSA